MRNGITYLHLGRSFDTRNDISHITCRNLFGRLHIQFQHTYLIRIVFLTRIEETHTVIRFHRTINHLEIGDNSTEWIEHRVKYQALQWRLRVSLWRSNTFNDSIQNLRYAVASLSRATQYLLTLTTQQIDDLILHFLWHSRVHIALIHHRDNLQVVIKSHIKVGNRLRLHTLRCIYDQQRSLASSDTTTYLVREVHVSRSVNEVEGVALVVHLDSVRLNSNTTLFLQVHIIQHLILHQALVHRSSVLNQSIRQSGLTMIDVCNNTKVSYIFHISIIIFFNDLFLNKNSPILTQFTIGCKGSKKNVYVQEKYVFIAIGYIFF